MFPLKRCLTAIAVALIAGEASAQQYRPDAEGYPCGAHKALTVVQDGPGFSIRRSGDPASGTSAARITSGAIVAIGNALRVDRRIFAIAQQRSEDENHAQRR